MIVNSYCCLSTSKYFEMKAIFQRYNIWKGDFREAAKKGEFFWLTGITI